MSGGAGGCGLRGPGQCLGQAGVRDLWGQAVPTDPAREL